MSMAVVRNSEVLLEASVRECVFRFSRAEARGDWRPREVNEEPRMGGAVQGVKIEKQGDGARLARGPGPRYISMWVSTEVRTNERCSFTPASVAFLAEESGHCSSS